MLSTSNKAYYVKFTIGHTRRSLPEDQVYTKVCPDGVERTYNCDWHLYLDAEGDPRIIARVECDMGPWFVTKRQYVQNRPKKIPIVQQEDDVNDDDDTAKWRCFESRQRCWGWPGTVRFRIVGISGNDLKVKYDGSEVIEGYFCDQLGDGPSNLKPLPLPSNVGFSLQTLPLQESQFGEPIGEVATDQSVFVTPLQCGEEGIRSIQGQVSDLQTVNLSAGFIVSVVVDSTFAVAQKLALNFVKYEEAMDEMLRMMREKNSGSSHSCVVVGDGPNDKSNRDAVSGNTNKQKHETLLSCSTIEDLIQTLSPDAAAATTISEGMYKFTLTEDSTRLTAKFFFAQMEGVGSDGLENLIRFSVLFVHHSMRLRKPKSLKPERSPGEQIDLLFQNVVRDRFVEEALVIKDDDYKSILPDSDSTMLNLSECMDGLSFVESVHGLPGSNTIPMDVFGDSLLDPESQGVARKRPRAMDNDGYVMASICGNSSPSSESLISIPATTHYLDPLFCYDLEHDQLFTASKLKSVLKKLSMTVGNQKALRLEALKRYFEARNTELNNHFTAESMDEAMVGNGGILGMELVLKEDATSDDITLILRGGKKVSRQRTSVDIPKSENLVSDNISSSEMERVCTKLGIPVGAAHLDMYMNGLQAPTFADGNSDPASCRFVLVQDFVPKP